MAAALYLLVALATLFAWHRLVRPLSRAAALVVLLAPACFTGPALVTDRVYGGYDLLFLVPPFSDYAAEHRFEEPHNKWLIDHVTQMAPWQRQVRAAYARGDWPLWNPAMNSGDILAATMQPAPYSPLNLIAMLLPLALAPAFTASMILFLAALFAFSCARELECSERASLIAAVGFSFSGAMLFWVGWTHLGGSWTLLPLVLLAVRRLIRTGNFALLTIAFVLLILYGHPESMMHIVAIGVAWGVFELVEDRHSCLSLSFRQRWEQAGLPVLHSLLAAALALLITAIFLMPFVALMQSTWEYSVRLYEAEQPSRVEVRLIWNAMRATFLPYYGGASWHTLTNEWNYAAARVGSIVLALAAIAALRLWQKREVRFLIVLAAICLLAGWNAPPIEPALRALPLFKLAINDRLGCAAGLALSLLASFAFDARAKRDRAIVIGVAVLLAIGTATFWRFQWSVGVDQRLLIAGALAELFGIAILLLPKRGIVLLLAAIVIQRAVEDGNIYPTLPRSSFYPATPLIEKIPRDPLYRASATGAILIPNVASMYGLEDVRGYTTMNDVGYLETIPLWSPQATRHDHDIAPLGKPFLSFLGVRHAITPRDMAPPDGWRVVADDRSSRLMENTRAIPRVFAPRHVRLIESDVTALAEMEQAADFADIAWIHTRDVPTQTIGNGDARLQVKRDGARYEIDVETTSGTRVVISETGWPGWRAYVDDRRVRLDRANHAFLAVWVPEGKHRVRVEYLPDAFVRGRAISITTLFLLAVALAAHKWRTGTPAGPGS